MIVLEINSLDRKRLLILDHVSLIEFNGISKSLDFYLGIDNYSVFLDKSVAEETVLSRLHASLRPLYDGRLNQVLGIKLELDLRDLQGREEVF